MTALFFASGVFIGATTMALGMELGDGIIFFLYLSAFVMLGVATSLEYTKNEN